MKVGSVASGIWLEFDRAISGHLTIAGQAARSTGWSVILLARVC
jgi:hypothetical protein